MQLTHVLLILYFFIKCFIAYIYIFFKVYLSHVKCILLAILPTETCALPSFQSWGAEGYHLWVIPSKQERGQQEEQEEEVEMVPPPQSSLQAGILQFHFIKSALTVNPCTVRREMGTHSRVRFVYTYI